jgi:hypothetical protein
VTTAQWERFYDALSAALARLAALPTNDVEAYTADLAAHAESRQHAARAGGAYTLPAEPDPLAVLVEIGLELTAASGPFTTAVALEISVEDVVLSQIAHELEAAQLSELARLYPALIAERAPRYLPDGEETGPDLWERNLREILEERIFQAAAVIASARDKREAAAKQDA